MGKNIKLAPTNAFLCCKDCSKRNMTCHDNCDIYKKAKENYENMKQKINFAKPIFSTTDIKNLNKKGRGTV